MASSSSAATTVVLERVVSNRDGISRTDLPGVVTYPKKPFFTLTPREVSNNGSDTESQLQGGRRLDEFDVSDWELRSPQNGTSALQSFSDPPMNRYKMLASCLMLMANGLNDSAAGVVILYMEKTYHIGYAVVSIIFVATAVGFILSSLFTDSMNKKLGAAKTLAVAEALKVIAYSLIAPVLPYPAICIAFLLVGAAMSLELGIVLTFGTNLANGTTMLGILTASYSVGGIIGPLIATTLTARGVLWSRFYLITLGFALVNVFLATWSFWHHELEAQIATLPPASGNNNTLRTAGKFGTMQKAFKNKITLLSMFFLFVYQGAEVSVSGWVITYLITYRKGDPSSVGYVTAGFWAGITIGRLFLTKPLSRLGEKRSNYMLMVGAMIFESIVWAVPNVIGDAVAVCVVGLLIGPVYPIACEMFVKMLPSDIQVASISLMQGMGSSGGAALPFITGVLAQVAGTFVVHPIVLVAMALELVTWFFLPTLEKMHV